ncbi:helix-turn-helix transcriptional regulator [Azospirillum argentinense]|uniref:Helix-turn-helix transcriptional regulator n=1 Tax=Azospirillum argentinense TaxID=2970906 RepID=A0ABW8VCI5_9PROT
MLTELEAAKHLGISPKTLTRWRWLGTGPAFVKVGARAVRYREEDLRVFLEAGRHAPTHAR